jgi:hypothetical protein
MDYLKSTNQARLSTKTQQDLPDKNKVRLDMQRFLAVGFVLPKPTKS